MNLYQPQFCKDLDLAETEVRKSVLIASTPRCGSHMIGHAMARSGLLGVPFEYLNPANLSEWSRRLGTDAPDKTLRQIMSRRTSSNGVFGIKAHFEHCRSLGGHAKLFAALPGVLVVHIRRADTLRQAISYAIARQTGVWISGQEATADGARFDPGLIRDCLNDIAIQNAEWSTAFANAGIMPLNLFYEDVVQDLSSAVTAVAHAADVLPYAESLKIETPTARQSKSAETDLWIQRYADEQQRPSSVQRLRSRIARAVGQ